jgi:pimeloyl-ACP methyl ester carboxylesterase
MDSRDERAADAERATALETEELRIPGGDPGVELYLRNRRPRAGAARARVVLFVHGSTYPAEATFDLRLGGTSWMEYIARRGWDVYFADLRGYGRSTRPPEMDEPASANPPLVRTETALKDVSAAVEFILRRRGAAKLVLIGWSWGTTLAAAYTARNAQRVDRLVLIAPQWLRRAGERSALDQGGALGAYRTMTREQMREHWLRAVPAHRREDLVPRGWFEAFAEAVLASDPASSRMEPAAVRAPNGTVQDARDYWCCGKPLYDPRAIRVPVLLTHSEWDEALPAYMARALFAELVNAPWRRLIEFGEGTHYPMLEKHRMQLFREVQLFLEERHVAEA